MTVASSGGGAMSGGCGIDLNHTAIRATLVDTRTTCVVSPPKRADYMHTNEGRQPEVRSSTMAAIIRLDDAVTAAEPFLSQWGCVDTLDTPQVVRLSDTMCHCFRMLDAALPQLVKVVAKRNGQSVSGRLTGQRDAATRHNARLRAQLIALGQQPVS